MSRDKAKVVQLNDLIGDDTMEICPHCTNREAHYEVEDDTKLILRCICGYHKVLYHENQDKVVNHVLPKRRCELPRPGSKLSICLGALASVYPKSVKTNVVGRISQDTTSGAASKLMVLQHKGLVEKVTSLRGVSGGSTWMLTNRGAQHLQLQLQVS